MPDFTEEIEQYMRETNTSYEFAEAVIASRQPQTEVKETVSEEVVNENDSTEEAEAVETPTEITEESAKTTKKTKK